MNDKGLLTYIDNKLLSFIKEDELISDVSKSKYVGKCKYVGKWKASFVDVIREIGDISAECILNLNAVGTAAMF